MVKALRLAMALAAIVTVSPGCSSRVDTVDAGHGGADRAAAVGCSGKIGAMLPYGGASGIDTFQMNWARVALDTFNREHGSEFSLEPKDVDVDPAQAVAAARELARDPSVIGVVGPRSSVATLAVGPILDSANLTYVSPSATLASLTDGSLKHFFRVVANDSVQGPDIANFIASDLSPRRVLVVGDSGAYSAALSKAITSVLAEKGVEVSRSSVDLKKPDPNAVLKAMTPDTNVVVLTGDSPVAQSVADAIAAEEFHPVIVATDNMFDLDKFDVPGAYVFSFSPSVENVDGGERLLQTYRAIFGDLEPYGGPAYVAMQVILTAALDSCDNHEATRAGVTRGIRQVVLPSTILGYPVAFDSRGDLTGGRFFRYRIEGGRFVAQQDR